VGTGARLLKPCPSAEEGQELVAQSASAGGLWQGWEREEKEKEAEMKGQEEGVEQGTVAASTPRGGGAAGGGNPASDELAAGAIPELRSRGGMSWHRSCKARQGSRRLPSSGSAQELKRQWEALTGYKGLPETTVLRILQHAARAAAEEAQGGGLPAGHHPC